uniref:Tetratricopeptide repeat protein 38 n=1 Tax=Chromera velia CCMP2878 TaxID=1169474 RepID=A0A0G4HQC1_9ALVE|eukprot:Cvel_7937.t1-p1 / transcript=Cvel_7937.t1 / gene=Cvel_7937 / organism=Chromera_velia_CCMP2878 / gene_product=Tetratricopeptide repeat protein 38, putative / transcript_product=Tetratricopeptide repeat protein 38, putative / location=Cvel_scaffold426:14800-20082(-) / protein_length=594 / sequence_SO=supercontig / SO=protein_coding / is_pseudo=false
MSSVSLDCFGCPVDTASSSCLEKVNGYMDCVLGYGKNWGDGAKASEADPDSQMAFALSVDFQLCSYRFGDVVSSLSSKPSELLPSKDDVSVPSAREDQASLRARLYIEALRNWIPLGNPGGAAELYYQAVRIFPSDLFALKRAQLLYFVVGQPDRMLSVVESEDVRGIRSFHFDNKSPYFHGMRSFALEQNGRLDEALSAAETALAVKKDDLWAQHGLAHVTYFKGSLLEGLSRFVSFSDSWATGCSFMESHNWWHVAVFLLDMRRNRDALEVVRRKAWGIDKSNVQDQLGALGFLLKLEIRLRLEGEAGGEGMASVKELQREREVGSGVIKEILEDVLQSARSSGTLSLHAEPLFDCLAAMALSFTGCETELKSHLEGVRSVCGSVKKGVEERRRFAEVWEETVELCGRLWSEGPEVAVGLLRLEPGFCLLIGSYEQCDVLREAGILGILQRGKLGSSDTREIWAEAVRASGGGKGGGDEPHGTHLSMEMRRATFKDPLPLESFRSTCLRGVSESDSEKIMRFLQDRITEGERGPAVPNYFLLRAAVYLTPGDRRGDCVKVLAAFLDLCKEYGQAALPPQLQALKKQHLNGFS